MIDWTIPANRERLIAAAPDLCEALAEMVASHSPKTIAQMNAWKAALAKAEAALAGAHPSIPARKGK